MMGEEEKPWEKREESLKTKDLVLHRKVNCNINTGSSAFHK